MSEETREERRGLVDHETRFLLFVNEGRSPSGMTGRWTVRSRRGDTLGGIGWYGPWRCYTFNPEAGTTYNDGCLRDIAAFIERQKKVDPGRPRSWGPA